MFKQHFILNWKKKKYDSWDTMQLGRVKEITTQNNTILQPSTLPAFHSLWDRTELLKQNSDNPTTVQV